MVTTNQKSIMIDTQKRAKNPSRMLKIVINHKRAKEEEQKRTTKTIQKQWTKWQHVYTYQQLL